MKSATLRLAVTQIIRGLRPAATLSCLLVVAGLSACSKDENAAGADKAIIDQPKPAGEQQALVERAPVKQAQPAAKAQPAKIDPSAYKTIEWTDLIPKDDLDALLSPPEYLDEIEDGSEADQIDSQTQSLAADASDDRYQQALASKRIIAEYNNAKIRMPGFVVPLEFDDDMAITEFFLVPYFGACIHLPPPPPNQVVHVTYKAGLKAEALYDPFWVSGTLKTHVVENDVATAAYTLNAVAIEPYDEPTP